MSINFPAPLTQTPLNTFSPTSTPAATSNGTTYVWNGTVWRVSGADAFVSISGDTMTGDLTVPNLVSEGDVQTTSLNGGQLAGFRNQIINGDFRVWERGTTVTNAGAAAYTADRWKETGSTVGATVIRRNAGPKNIGYSAKISANSGSLQQSIELDRPGNNSQFGVGSTWTMSVWSDQDLTTETPWARFRKSSISTSDQIDASNTFNKWQSTGETSNGFTRYFHTFTIDNEVTNNDITCLTVVLPSGATFGVITSYTGVQLEPGSLATEFEHRPIGTELSLCHRYYFTASLSSGMPCVNGSVNGSDERHTNFRHPVYMRVPPTIVNTGGVINGSVSSITGGSKSTTASGKATTNSQLMMIKTCTFDAEL